jgi:hypothetical protein
MNISVEQLVELALQAESRNPIEWGELPVDETVVYTTFAKAMLLAYSNIQPENRDIVLLGSVVKLQSENFALLQHNKILLETIRRLNNRE